MLKSELIKENAELKKRIKELENEILDIRVNRIRFICGTNKFDRDIECVIYENHDRNSAVTMQFTSSIAIEPMAANSFIINFI